MGNFDEAKLSRTEDRLLREEIRRIVAEHAPITVRGVYYQCVLSQKLPFLSKDRDGSKRNYVLVNRRLNQLRKIGAIRWDAVVDPSRPSNTRKRHRSISDFADIAALYYSRDFWCDAPIRPIVLIEKEGQVPVYEQHADQYGVAVWACKGYSSISHIRALAEYISGLNQDVLILVGADWDPSGCDWPRAAEKELRSHLSGWQNKVSFQRILVNSADVERLRASVALRAANPNDPRTADWLINNNYRPDDEIVVEMDALPPNEARRRMQSVFEKLRLSEDPKWNLYKDSELLEKDRVRISEALSLLKS